MKKFMFVVLIMMLLLAMAIPAFAAQDAPKCDGLVKVLEHIPPDSPGYAKVLEKGQEDCGVAFEHAALLALYYSTNGPDWTRGTWPVDTDDDHCDWLHVYCNTDGRVFELGLYRNNLSGAIPAELGYLSNLQYLTLYGNKLSGAIPAELGNLSNLQYLDAGDNDLSGTIPAELGNLSNLWFLDLYNNQLSGAIPAELGNLSNLQYLYLHNNQLSGAIPAELGNLSNLQYLDLRNNLLMCWETQAVKDWAETPPLSPLGSPFEVCGP